MTIDLTSVQTGAYTSDGIWTAPTYITGISFAYGPEARSLAAFDVSGLPDGTIHSATLSLQNPYTVNEVGGDIELRLYGLPGMTWFNYTGNGSLNMSNFSFIGSSLSPLWGSTLVAPVSWPGSTVTFELPAAALDALRQAADGSGPFSGDFFAFGLRIVKADVEEPKPLQYVFGGTSAGGTVVRLTVDVVPVPATVSLFGAGLAGLAGFARWRRSELPTES
ncbi:MAG: PEP-CTERM sorting domain-containing protein [Nitrospira sp.]|nr:PEP-CTERM sorting domain-containing protein [Nitrospira sp.]